MTLKVLSDPHGLVSSDDFVIALDEGYATLHKVLDILHAPDHLEKIDLSPVRHTLTSIADSLRAFHLDDSLHGEFKTGFTRALHKTLQHVEQIHSHIQHFETAFNEVVHPYNETRQSLHEDIHKVNQLLAQVRYQNPHEAIADTHGHSHHHDSHF